MKLIYNVYLALRGHCGLEVKATDCPFNNEVKICLTYTSSQKVYHPFNNEVNICLTYTSSQKVYQVLDKQSINQSYIETQTMRQPHDFFHPPSSNYITRCVVFKRGKL